MEEKKELREKIIKGLELYQRKLIKTKKVRNLELVVSDDQGNVVRIPSHELQALTSTCTFSRAKHPVHF
jgi:hypothetical protein